MLEQMSTGCTFSLTYITYDSKRKKGGKIISYLEARLAKSEEQPKSRGRTQLEETKQRTAEIKAGRDPRHHKWYTRNIVVMQNGVPTSLVRKIHPPLVTIFNDQIVVA